MHPFGSSHATTLDRSHTSTASASKRAYSIAAAHCEQCQSLCSVYSLSSQYNEYNVYIRRGAYTLERLSTTQSMYTSAALLLTTPHTAFTSHATQRNASTLTRTVLFTALLSCTHSHCIPLHPYPGLPLSSLPLSSSPFLHSLVSFPLSPSLTGRSVLSVVIRTWWASGGESGLVGPASLPHLSTVSVSVAASAQSACEELQ